MQRRYYSVAEVNAVIPALTRIFTRVLQLRGQLRAVYKRLEAKRFAPDDDDFDPEVAGAPDDVLRERRLFKGLLDTLKSDLLAVQETGCMIKDLETGLCDWFTRSGAHEVLLCWRFGETEVAFFHDLESGFAGRRPVSELEPPGPRAFS